MNKLSMMYSAEELFERLSDRYTAAEMVELLGMTNEDLEDIGMVNFIDRNFDALTSVLESVGMLE